jgi:hypothetical protein
MCEAKWNYINTPQLAAVSVSKACFGVPVIFPARQYNCFALIVETPIPKANNLKVTMGAAELVSCNETQ